MQHCALLCTVLHCAEQCTAAKEEAAMCDSTICNLQCTPQDTVIHVFTIHYSAHDTMQIQGYVMYGCVQCTAKLICWVVCYNVNYSVTNPQDTVIQVFLLQCIYNNRVIHGFAQQCRVAFFKILQYTDCTVYSRAMGMYHILALGAHIGVILGPMLGMVLKIDIT